MNRLTKRESDIMGIFWKYDQPLSSNDIHTYAPEISINTIQPNLKKLCKNGFIKVAGVGFTKNSITRQYTYVISQSEYIKHFLEENTSFQLASAFVKESNNQELIAELRKLIDEKLKG